MSREWSEKRVAEIIRTFKGEPVTVQTLLRIKAILLAVERCECALRLHEPHDKVTAEMSQLWKGIKQIVGETRSACMRTWFFGAPENQERALEEIEWRKELLEKVVRAIAPEQ